MPDLKEWWVKWGKYANKNSEHSNIKSLNKYLLTTQYLPDSALSVKAIAANNNNRISALTELTLLCRERKNNKVKYTYHTSSVDQCCGGKPNKKRSQGMVKEGQTKTRNGQGAQGQWPWDRSTAGFKKSLM